MLKKSALLILLSLSSLMAQDYLSLDGSSSHIDGPNCWNGALYAAGVMRTKRFIHPDEWLYRLQKNCHKVVTPRRGDVGRVFGIKGEVHGFIHLDEETIFAKHGQAKKDGYKVMSYSEMMDQYGKDRDCKIRRSNEPECFHKVEYYQCAGGSLELPELTRFDELLEEVLFSQETKMIYKEGCDEGSFLRREEILKEMISILEGLRNVDFGPLSPLLRESYTTQIYDIEVSNRNYKCPYKLKKKTVSELKYLLKDIF